MMTNTNFTVMNYDGVNSTIKTVCPFCHKEWRFNVPMEPDEFVSEINRMLKGNLCIQDVFPMIDNTAREGILTGICDECYPDDDDNQGDDTLA